MTTPQISYDSKITQLPEGAAWPTSLTAPLPVGSIDLGMTEQSSGEVFSRSVTLETRKAHQKGQSVRDFVTDAPQTLAATFLESTPAVRALYHGAPEVDGHITSGNGVVKGTFVYDTFDPETDSATRYVFRATVTPNGDITYVDTELTMYPVLFTALGDVEIYTSDPAPVTP